MKGSRFIAAGLCLAGTVQAQINGAGGPVVQAPAVVVQETGLGAADAGSATAISWDPAAAIPQSGWQELEENAGNFHVSQAGAGGYGSLFAVRGVANTPYFSDPAVTVYLGDIPLPSSFAYPEDLLGFTSATLYRGPQGADFGRATDGGVIVFAPAPANEATAGFGSYDARSAAVSAGAGGVVAMAGYDAREGYIENDEIRQRVDGQENENGYAQASIPLSAADKVTLEAFGTRARDGAEPLVPLGGPYYSVARAQEGVTDTDSLGAAVRFDAELPGGGSVRSVTSFTDWRMDPFTNFLVLPPPLASEIVQDQKSWNEELHVASGALGPVTVSGGLWLSGSTTVNFVDRAIPGLFPIEVSSFDEGTRQGALFADAVWTVAPGWSLSVGGRGEVTDRTFLRREAVPVPDLDYMRGGHYGALLPKAALDWTGGADEHAQLAIAAGLRPGGFSSYTDNPALIPFAAERMVSYSAGCDKSWADQAWRVALRAFDEEISNYQIERSYTATDYFVADAGHARAEGAEAELRWRPAPGWTLSATGGWTRAVLTAYASPITGQNLSGNAAPYIPLYNANIDATWRPGRGWFAGVRESAVGRTYYDELETTAYEQHA
ncbi:MAG TPA: TonB-dependent receptor, partial [Opitutaceae bacterium]|nr:TonB-dependent receptor [Opitutaceae bacterium]